jgi:hypothetical protein
LPVWYLNYKLRDNNMRLRFKDQEANVFGKIVAAYSENCKEQIIHVGEMSCVRMLEMRWACR